MGSTEGGIGCLVTQVTAASVDVVHGACGHLVSADRWGVWGRERRSITCGGVGA